MPVAADTAGRTAECLSQGLAPTVAAPDPKRGGARAKGAMSTQTLSDCPTDGLVFVEIGEARCPECGKFLPTSEPPHGTGWGDDGEAD